MLNIEPNILLTDYRVVMPSLPHVMLKAYPSECIYIHYLSKRLLPTFLADLKTIHGFNPTQLKALLFWQDNKPPKPKLQDFAEMVKLTLKGS
jgi:hypothetical protein